MSNLVTDRERVYWEADGAKFCAFGDRVLIQEDQFKSGYECGACEGHGKVKCSNCDGHGYNVSHKPAWGDTPATQVTKRCTQCEGQKSVTCPECGGKGGLLIVPDQSQRRPSSGVVVSTGPGCKELAVGDKVLYSNYAGHAVDTSRSSLPVVLRVLHETEVLAGVDGHLEMRYVRRQTEAMGTGA